MSCWPDVEQAEPDESGPRASEPIERGRSGDTPHRIVIFGDGADKTRLTIPFSLFDSEEPEDLGRYRAGDEKTISGSVFALPHNDNLSHGLKLSGMKHSLEATDWTYAESRARSEPLNEMTQIKDDEEGQPLQPPEDEFADFENGDVVRRALDLTPQSYREAIETGAHGRHG